MSSVQRVPSPGTGASAYTPAAQFDRVQRLTGGPRILRAAAIAVVVLSVWAMTTLAAFGLMAILEGWRPR